MKQYEIKAYGQLNKLQQEEVLEVFLEGFGHMMTFSKDKQELKDLFATAFHPSYIYAYIENDKVLGILGIATYDVRPIKLDLDQCTRIYGKVKGNILCKQMNLIFQSRVVKKSTDIYIDVLAIAKEVRGRGIGTKLLEYVLSLSPYTECCLEVLSKNSSAKKLYEKNGFRVYKKKYFSFTTLMGLGYPIKMRRSTNGEEVSLRQH